jgi:CheY-like chemotaxis protein
VDHDIVVAIIGVLPQIFLLSIGAILAIQYRKQLGAFLSTRATSVSAFGFRMDLTPGDVVAAVTSKPAPSNENEKPVDLAGSSRAIVDRATRLRTRLAGRTVLWVDDNQRGLRTERRLLRQLGIFVEPATTNEEAMLVMRSPDERIDLVISDIRRVTGESGLGLVADIHQLPNPPGIVLYIGRVDKDRSTPAGVLGVTNRPDELLNLVMDALDRLPDRPGQ